LSKQDTTIAISKDLHKRIKEYTKSQETTIKQVVQYLLNEYMEKREKIILKKSNE
jgi:hypothetical protein